MAELSGSERGVFVIAVTPFTDDGELDPVGIDQVVDFYLRSGVAGITILGVMGEAHRMTEAEAVMLTERVVQRVDGRVPVVAGVTSPSLTVLAELAGKAMDLGCAGVMLQPLAGLIGDDAVHDYMSVVCETLGPKVPIVYQDFPKASGVHLSVDVWNRIVDDFPQVVMLKHEDQPGFAKLTRIRADEVDEGRRRVSILAGNNGLYLPQELARGADGAMTGFAYPDVLVQVCDRFFAGDDHGAEDLFDAYLPLNRYEFARGLAVRKELLRRRGAIPTARSRYPVKPPTQVDHLELDRLLARLERVETG